MLMTPKCNRSSWVVTAATVALFVSSVPVLAQKTISTLYQRVGGYDFIAKFVDTTFPRVSTQPQLHRFFQGHSTDSQLKQRQLIIDALCKEMGGPCIYIGRPMRPLHDGLHITDSDWAEFMKIITAILVELKVSPAGAARLDRVVRSEVQARHCRARSKMNSGLNAVA